MSDNSLKDLKATCMLNHGGRKQQELERAIQCLAIQLRPIITSAWTAETRAAAALPDRFYERDASFVHKLCYRLTALTGVMKRSCVVFQYIKNEQTIFLSHAQTDQVRCMPAPFCLLESQRNSESIDIKLLDTFQIFIPKTSKTGLDFSERVSPDGKSSTCLSTLLPAV